METTKIASPRVLVTGVSQQQSNFDYTMNELSELAKADGLTVVGEVRQNLERAITATYFGKGKISEIQALAQQLDADFIIVNDELSPSQIRNLEQALNLKLLDRTQLILEIFANRAQTKIAKLQVAIAQARYQLPRLHPSENKLDQQGGGGGLANRGAGETQLELNRRTLLKQISKLKAQLQQVTQQQAVQKKQRQKNTLPTVALVGYTNAGKSTTLNQILKHYAANAEEKQVFQKDMLFATLDTNVRMINLANQQKFLLSDTVGFVSKLPHHLVAAFKATLNEASDADILIHVVDYSDEHYQDMINTTNETLADLGITDKPTIMAFNKADLKSETPYPIVTGSQIVYSATQKSSIDQLVNLITQTLFAQLPVFQFLIPYTKGAEVTYLNQHGHVLQQSYEADGTLLKVQIADTLVSHLLTYQQ